MNPLLICWMWYAVFFKPHAPSHAKKTEDS